MIGSVFVNRLYRLCLAPLSDSHHASRVAGVTNSLLRKEEQFAWKRKTEIGVKMGVGHTCTLLQKRSQRFTREAALFAHHAPPCIFFIYITDGAGAAEGCLAPWSASEFYQPIHSLL